MLGILDAGGGMQDKFISYIGIGGSDWATRIEADFEMFSMSPAWTTIDKKVFGWSKSICMSMKRTFLISMRCLRPALKKRAGKLRRRCMIFCSLLLGRVLKKMKSILWLASKKSA